MAADPYEAFKLIGTRANATWYAAVNASGTQVYFCGPLLQGCKKMMCRRVQTSSQPTSDIDFILESME